MQKTATQLYDYNHDENEAAYTKPVVDLGLARKYWGYLTKGMTQNELADFEAARDQLEHYDKLYTLIEYVSKLHDGITALERRF